MGKTKTDVMAEQPAVCVLKVLDANARELNEHLKWLHERLAVLEAHCNLKCRPNPTEKPTIMAAKTAGWGNGNKT